MNYQVPPLPPSLQPGDVVPWFKARTLDGNQEFAFNTAAGRHILLLLFGSAARPHCAAALAEVQAHRHLLDDERASFFGVTIDREDVEKGRVAKMLPGIRYFLDYDRLLSRLLGADASGTDAYRPHWLLIDPTLRVIGRYDVDHGYQAFQALEAAIGVPAVADWAPVIMVPHILEPELCRHLISLYEQHGGKESGFMRDADHKTVLMTDPRHKSRRDYTVADKGLQKQLSERVVRRLLPAVKRYFQFDATRMERYLVGCYDAETGGHFRPHRDNTTKGTAHRRFAVTVNLNAGEYDGGDLRFPEFGGRTYRAPTGGAVAFSCSMLHEATPVTRGRRYAFLPFLYDEAAALIREQNSPYLAGNVRRYTRN